MKNSACKTAAFLLATSLVMSTATQQAKAFDFAEILQTVGLSGDPKDKEIEALKKDIRIKALKGEEITLDQKFALGSDQFKDMMQSYTKGFMPLLVISFALNNLGKSIGNARDLYASAKNAVNNFIFKITYKGININKYKGLLERTEKRLRSEIVGQDEAIDKILNVMTGHFEAMLETESLGKKYEKGLVLYLIGPSGTGKSTAMKIIGEEMGLKPYVARMSDVVEDKGNDANSVVARLTKPVIQDTGRVKVSIDTPFTMRLKSGIPTLYFIDEFDKMRKLDATLRKTNEKDDNGKIISGSGDEMLRNFGDTGQINGLNASGSVLISTSNETEAGMEQLEDSLYNRYKDCVIKFDELKASDYKEIIKRKTVPTQEFYKNKFNVDVKWDEAALDYFAKKFESKNMGARSAEALISSARCVLKTYRDKDTDDFCGKELILNFDKNSGKIFVE